MSLPERCVDLKPVQVVRALRSRAAMQVLLQHMARIARPAEGAPKILVPIARMASSDCDWLEGGLRVDISGTAEKTQIAIAVELGGGVRELLFPRLSLAVPKNELFRAVKLAPVLVHPMKSRLEKDGRLILSCEADAVGTIPPPAFEISEASIRRSLPPALRRSLPPMKQVGASAATMKIDMPAIDEAAILGRMIPKRPPLPKLDDLDEVDVGWDDTRAPSAVDMPSARRSKAPPARASKPPSGGPSKPPRPLPKPSSAPARPSKRPARPSTRPKTR